MKRRALSLFLSMSLLLSMAVPAASAADENVLSDTANVDVVKAESTTQTEPGTTEPIVTEPKSAIPECDCGNPDADAISHADSCSLKKYYSETVCSGTAEEIYAQWDTFPEDGKYYILQYLSWTDQTKLDALNKLISEDGSDTEDPEQPTTEPENPDVPEDPETPVEDTETAPNGATVSVSGIPADTELQVAEASEETKASVDAYVQAQGDDSAQQLFIWDISLQNAQGVETQPDGNVRVELEVPGVKLHKYATVYVVHVDDEGTASTLGAEVTEDGKIAFVTDSFSTFAGFTVDFEYDGQTFSINGKETILLSELFDALKMPLYVSDVANVDFDDDSLIRVEEQADGDWLLTSLQAFDTEQKLTVTMDDGTVYVINVTDAAVAGFYVLAENGTDSGAINWNYGDLAGGDGVITILLDGDGCPQINGDSTNSWITDERRFIVAGGGVLYLELQHASIFGTSNTTSSVNTLIWNLMQIRITDGSTLVIRLGGSFEGDETITIRHKANDNDNRPTTAGISSMFEVEEGNLIIRCSDVSTLPTELGIASNKKSYFSSQGAEWADNSKDYIPLYIDGQNKATSVYHSLIHFNSIVGSGEHAYIEDVTFRNATYRAMLVRSNDMANLHIMDCVFEETVDCQFAGGAICINDTTLANTNGNTYQVNVDNFTLKNCKFYKNSSTNQQGGAVASFGNLDNTVIDGCLFDQCTAGSRGGAVEICANTKTVNFDANNQFVDTVNMGAIQISNSRFNSNTCASHGGAIDISYGDNKLKLSSLSISGCTFTSNTATNNRGGAIRMVADCGPFEISGTTFSKCEALNSHGGAISLQGTVGDFTVSNDSQFLNCTSGARGGAIGANCTSYDNIELSDSTFSGNTSGTLGGAVHFGLADGTSPITAKDVSVTGCTFENNSASGVGGGLCLTDGAYQSVTVQNSTFTNCDTVGFGGGIGMKAYADDQADAMPFSVTGAIQILGCTFEDCDGGSLYPEPYDSDGDGTKEETWDHDGNPDTPEVLRLNGVSGGGAIAIGGTVSGSVTIQGTDANNYSKFSDCTTWNNGGAIALLASLKTAKVTLQYLDIDGCRARDAGNAVHLANVIIDSLDMKNCTVQNCSYFTEDCGIAIPAAYAELGKAAYASYDASGTFRVIGNTTCKAEINSCTFLNNKSYSNGGGVYWNANKIQTGATGSTIIPSLNIKNTTFDGNYAVRDGGGLYCEATVDVDACEFKNNTAGNRGGGIAQQVYSNEARTLGAGEATNLILDANTKIYDNSAVRGGGISITVSDTVSVPDGTNVIYPVKFTLGGAHVYSNKATQYGGGIYYAAAQYENALKQREVDNFQKEILIDNGLIYDNIVAEGAAVGSTTEGGKGGGIYMESNQVNTGADTGFSKLNITGGSIYSNTATNGDGGGIYLTGKNALCTITGGTIGGSEANANKATGKRNTDSALSTGRGGGIAISGGATINMTLAEGATNGGVISYNEAGFQGGGIWIDAKGTSTGSVANTMTLDQGSVLYNKVTATDANSANGGGIYIGDSGSFTITNGEVKHNSTIAWGGGIYTHKGFITVSGGEISYNQAGCGGGIGIQNLGALATINGGTITENIATDAGGGGGGIFATGSNKVQVDGGDILKNKATAGDGGGIYATHGASVTVTHGNIQENTAKLYGGGIYAQTNSTVAVSGGNILKNTCTEGNGGGLHVYDSSTVTITNGDIQYNTAHLGFGGGIHAYQNSTVTISGGNVLYNEAKCGGGIGAEKSALVEITGGEITHNTAKDAGGGIYADTDAKVTVAASGSNRGDISYNTGSRGGGVYVAHGAVLNVNNGYITYNNALGKPSGKTTAYNENGDLLGVGGGVYVADGNSAENRAIFTLEGDKIAIYGNLADFGADDVFANGIYTDLNVPDVAQMELSGLGFQPEGWFEDYPINDTRYSLGLNLGVDRGIKEGEYVFRYKGSEATQRVEISPIAPANEADTYVCMTLGIGSGKLKITKQVNANNGTVDPNQYFLFRVQSESFLYEEHTPIDITVMVKAGGSVTVRDLPYGYYKVTEITNWSARYTPVSTNPTGGILINENTKETPKGITFENKLTNDKWLSGDAYADNAFGKLKNEEG